MRAVAAQRDERQVMGQNNTQVSGLLLIDKPAGWTSNQVLGRVKRLLGERKAGHTGTLDPFATGLLPVLLGEATKFSADLLDADKRYLADACLGVTTTTGDTEGEVLISRPVDVDDAAVHAVLSRFRGEIDQVPPMFSALKREGRPLYVLARQGIEVERAARRVHILALELLALEGSVLRFAVTCSKGTYVRTLAEDIGAALGCGAHLLALRRVATGSLDLSSAIGLERLEALSLAERRACVLPIDHLLQTLPRIELDAALAARFAQGQRLRVEGLSGRVRVYGPAGLLGTAMLEAGGRLQPQRLIAHRE